MTAPVITPYVGGVPQRTDPVNFSEYTDTWIFYQSELPDEYNSLSLYLDGLSVTVQGIADDAQDSADASASSALESSGFADDSKDSSEISAATANFKGIWANLTGALNIPASVEHEGAVYLLLNDLVDVTASEPSVTSDWLNITGVKYVVPVAGAELSTVSINRLKTSDTFKYPIASTIQEGISITVAILEVDKGITPQIDLQGGNSATNGADSVTDNVIYSNSFTGLDDAVCNGVDTWEF